MAEFFLFLRSLWASWMVWAGGILRVIPFLETLAEPSLRRKFPGIDKFLTERGDSLKRDLKLIALVCLFIGCYRAWVFEHNNAETAMRGKDGKADAWSKFNSCEIARIKNGDLATTYQSLWANQQVQIANQQSTVNSCVLALGKAANIEPRKLRTKYLPLLSVPDEKTEVFVVGVLAAYTNRAISPIAGNLRCSNPFIFQKFTILDDSGGPKILYRSEQIDDKTVRFSLSFPAWTPDAPLLFGIGTHGQASTPGQCAIILD